MHLYLLTFTILATGDGVNTMNVHLEIIGKEKVPWGTLNRPKPLVTNEPTSDKDGRFDLVLLIMGGRIESIRNAVNLFGRKFGNRNSVRLCGPGTDSKPLGVVYKTHKTWADRPNDRFRKKSPGSISPALTDPERAET